MLQRIVIAPNQIQDDYLQLTTEQQHYLCRVLRLAADSQFLAMDGQGQTWLAQLHGTTATLLAPVATQTELPIALTLVMALPKGNGFDEIVRQVTELGVGAIIPVISDRTLLQPSPQKLIRWRRIAQEAAEQSERQQVPVLPEPIAFSTHLNHINQSPSQKFLCVTRYAAPHLLAALQANHHQGGNEEKEKIPQILVAVGPEGGWTEAEVEQAIAVGYQPVSLGQRILRSLTAPVVALSLIAAASEQASSER